jgi:hypothetical protein
MSERFTFSLSHRKSSLSFLWNNLLVKIYRAITKRQRGIRSGENGIAGMKKQRNQRQRTHRRVANLFLVHG